MTERDVYAVVLGRMLLAVRKENALSGEQLSALSNVTQSSISRFENGYTMPDLFELRGLVTDRPRFIRLVDEVHLETAQNLKTMRKNYTKLELVAVVTLVIEGFRASNRRWLAKL